MWARSEGVEMFQLKKKRGGGRGKKRKCDMWARGGGRGG